MPVSEYSPTVFPFTAVGPFDIIFLMNEEKGHLFAGTTTLSIMKLSIRGLNVTLLINATLLNSDMPLR